MNSFGRYSNSWQGKRVLITGVCGTVGKELLRQVSNSNPKEVIGVDINESELYFLGNEYRKNSNVHNYLGDMRDKDRLHRLMRGVDIVLHTAALKHVIVCEQSPHDTVQTNVIGTQNVIDAAIANNVERVLFTSSDKAVNPTNVMGTSKLMGERLMTAANATRQDRGPIFVSTRFGNVLGSRGSVIPLFNRQIEAGGPVTLTDTEMSRFIMTLERAVQLVMSAVFMGKGGEVFVTKSPVVRIEDLVTVMIEQLAPKYGHDPSDIEVNIIGSQPGEKLYEELVNDEEVRRGLELENYLVITPAFKAIYREIDYVYDGLISGELDRPYNSALEPSMNVNELRWYLQENDLLEKIPAVAR